LHKADYIAREMELSVLWKNREWQNRISFMELEERLQIPTSSSRQSAEIRRTSATPQENIADYSALDIFP